MPHAVGATPRDSQLQSPELAAAKPTRRLLSLLIWALLFRLAIAPWSAHGDIGTFRAWALRMAEVGPGRFWEGGYWCDYLPGYLYVLWGVGKVIAHLKETVTLISGQPFALLPQVWVLKLPAILADLGTAWILWGVARDACRRRGFTEVRSVDRAELLAILYLFNPVIFVNSSLWGQVDSIHAVGLVGGLALLARRKPLCAALVLGVAAAIKPHTAVILPLAAVYALATRMSVVRVLASGVVIVAVFVAAFAPFHTQALSQLPSFVDARWNETMKQYHFATVNAMNLWYLLGQNWHPDKALVGNAISMHAIGQALTIGTIVAAVAWAAWRTRAVGSAALWQAASLTYLGTFLFVTRAHERHVFPYFPMAMAAAATAPQVLIPYAMVSAATLANLGLAWRYMLPGKQSAELCPPVVGGGICLVILAALPLTWISFTNKGALWVEKGRAWLGGIGPRPIVRTQVAGNVAGDSESVRHGKLWLLAILVFALGIRLVRLNAPPERFFDEVYHAYTAERWLMGDKAAWFTGRAPDKDCAYEWTHPPLAKEFMWASLKVFGVHPWAWRLPAALFGTCCVALIYGLGLTLFRSERIALYAAAFATLDTLPLVLSRIGMNDIYMVGFMLAAVLAALRKRDVLAAALVGCAIACKWSGVFALPLLGLIHVVWVVPEKRWDVLAWVRRGLAYGLLVPGIYIASYIPFFQAGYTVKDFREIQWQMQHYHRNLKATHSFSSPAITWPFTYKQVWCYTHRYEPRASDAGIPAANPPTNRGVKVANVYALGNPAIWLAGLGALGLAAYTVIGTRNAALFIIIAGYLAFWVLWLFSPRIMFLYHYLPSLSFLYLALAWALPQLDPKGSNARFALILAFVVLVILYPYATAVPIPIWLTAGNWFRMT